MFLRIHDSESIDRHDVPYPQMRYLKNQHSATALGKRSEVGKPLEVQERF